ncbi:MAG: hypothetical protein JWM27_4736 [Gemmatimonadetes bacterium]|nr:hypothetical protein [Gemmatimonadota bacterium]
MRLALACLALVSLTACSRAPAASPSPVEVTISATPDRVWSALTQVYADFGMPIQTIDRASWLLRSSPMLSPQERHSNAQLFDCGAARGRGLMGWDPRMSDRAGGVSVTFSATTLLRPSGEGDTAVRTTITAHGPGNVECTSKGVVEQRLVDAIRAKL